jgi:FAD/FMN-containing dehydrogenase/Fe-S oxidoreductase
MTNAAARLDLSDSSPGPSHESTEALGAWLDLAGLTPPLPLEASRRLFARSGGDTSGQHTFTPAFVSEREFDTMVLPELRKAVNPDLLRFIVARVKKTFDIRKTLKKILPEIERIVGKGNFSALWLDREAFSADSMEHRALITEAVVHVYSAEALQDLVALLSKHGVPMIPYGEGGGYNMGVTPMAPAVTVSVRGIDHVSSIRPSRRTPGRFEISVGAGVPFKDLQAYLHKRGYVLRCDPNTPRAATGGIAATGSNAGRKAWEVILHGRAVTLGGTAVCFEADAEESRRIESEPFLMARKFFSVDDVPALRARMDAWRKRAPRACVHPDARVLSVPLQGMKAEASMTAQRAEAASRAAPQGALDPMASTALTPLPVSVFVGAEGSTGFIYEVTFEIETPRPWLRAARWHFTTVEAAMIATRAVKALPKEAQPIFFEIVSGQSIRRFLLQDFPTVFSETDEAVLFVACEGNTSGEAESAVASALAAARTALAEAGHDPSLAMPRLHETSTMEQSAGIEEFELLRRPREELPKKLRTKCKTDMEIRTEYLSDVLRIVENARPRALADRKQDVLFGHLTPNHTAIMHWNIGGFDLYDEEQADVAWDYLERVIGEAQKLAVDAGDPLGSARFTGEHGVAGKAPFLWINHIPPADFERMCAVKDVLDPDDIFNPETLFLRTSLSRSLRARLLAVSQESMVEARARKAASSSTSSSNEAVAAAEDFTLQEALRCTRCNSCKICPVIDAEHELEREGARGRNPRPVLPSKRNILMFLERVAAARRGAETATDASARGRVEALTNAMIRESADLLSKCFYCRKCDKACPVDIEIHPLMRAYHAMGKLPTMGSRLWGFVYERLMGEDPFKAFTYRLVALGTLLAGPFLLLLRKLPFVADWLKTYTVPPTLSLTHYEPAAQGARLREGDNFVVIRGRALSTEAGGGETMASSSVSRVVGHDLLAPTEVFIRYRGCMDTFGNPAATTSVDAYFKNVLGARILDLEKKMCCGFPFEADGLHERARQLQFASVVEIVKCAARVVEEWRAHPEAFPVPSGDGAGGTSNRPPRFIVFSNCPTCCEAIREMRALLADPQGRERVRVRAGLPPAYDFDLLDFDVKDTAEIAVDLLARAEKAQDAAAKDAASGLRPVARVRTLLRARKTVGLKVPCHNTAAATQAQLKLLGMYYTGVAAYDRCCGLSGTGRLKHPRIGTKISEKLFEQIRERPPQAVLSGCPSCRDGVKMQRDILDAKGDNIAKFGVAGIFEQILSDCPPANAP